MKLTKTNIQSEIEDLEKQGKVFFSNCQGIVSEPERFWEVDLEPDHYWNFLDETQKQSSIELRKQSIDVGRSILNVAKASVLMSEADERDLQLNIKKVAASFFMREYILHRGDVAHDEGRALGWISESQVEIASAPEKSMRIFDNSIKEIKHLLQLIDDQDSVVKSELVISDTSRFNKDTAFIMMAIDRNKPELEDVKDAIQEVFLKFNIVARRADEIEHQDVITDRIIKEIKTSEFIIADLTGERPSVYYEVGYAHAIGKRVILYRKKDTRIHFDLAHYNCPEYENIRELRELLTKRLESMTGRKVQ